MNLKMKAKMNTLKISIKTARDGKSVIMLGDKKVTTSKTGAGRKLWLNPIIARLLV